MKQKIWIGKEWKLIKFIVATTSALIEMPTVVEAHWTTSSNNYDGIVYRRIIINHWRTCRFSPVLHQIYWQRIALFSQQQYLILLVVNWTISKNYIFTNS